MKNALYLDDSYLKEFSTRVKSVKDGKFIVLEETAFYPSSGGQPNDEWTIKKGDEIFKVVFVGKFDGEISHEVDHPGLEIGDEIFCSIDWERRYRLMRMHTSAHVVSTFIHNACGALITGNQLGLDKTRIDFNLEEFDREKFDNYIREANEVLKKGLPVRSYYLPREEAMKIPAIIKLANALPPQVDELRIVKIGEFDTQADGGTHVKNTSEVGELEIIKLENKGATNRRLYYTIK
jgi:misacylated tRNA(Ala) deacylase